MLQNLHTHTTFCDGNDTPEEMLLEALNKGFASVGFSIHSSMSFSSYLHTTPDTMLEYKKEINALKSKYEDSIEVFCGVEAEMLSENDLSAFDYIIGSAHYLKIGDEYVGFDRDAKTVNNIITEYFGGNGLEYVKAYYETLMEMPKYVKADILGHFDLITKHSETDFFFDEASKLYSDYAFEAIDALCGEIPFFEVNTGAMARGYRTTPYPSIPIIKRLLEKGFLPIISSDCHDKKYLDCGFEMAADILEMCGAKERYILTGRGFEACRLR